VLGALALAFGTARALQLSWTSDDAYISFRYARNLVNHLGLVYNAGERVEGYTNFLWTLWCALGLRLGIRPESWANLSGVACFAATIALLAALSWRRYRAGWPLSAVPFAALALGVHRDACVFATGGLETALFTLLAVTGYAMLAELGRSTVAVPNHARGARRGQEGAEDASLPSHGLGSDEDRRNHCGQKGNGRETDSGRLKILHRKQDSRG